MYLPLYEGKMVQAFDHRAASVVVNPREPQPARPSRARPRSKSTPITNWLSDPQFWVSEDAIVWPDGLGMGRGLSRT